MSCHQQVEDGSARLHLAETALGKGRMSGNESGKNEGSGEVQQRVARHAQPRGLRDGSAHLLKNVLRKGPWKPGYRLAELSLAGKKAAGNWVGKRGGGNETGKPAGWTKCSTGGGGGCAGSGNGPDEIGGGGGGRNARDEPPPSAPGTPESSARARARTTRLRLREPEERKRLDSPEAGLAGRPGRKEPEAAAPLVEQGNWKEEPWKGELPWK